MKNALYTLFLIAFTFLASCNSISSKKNEKSVETTKTQETHDQKWKVTPDMLAYLRLMETEINALSANKNPTKEDYTALAELIDKNIRLLISNCTMDGQAHEELHNWLVPFIELSEEFDVAEDIKSQEAIYKKFKASFVTLNTTFE